MTIYLNPLFGGPLPNQDLPDAYADSIQARRENKTAEVMEGLLADKLKAELEK